MAKKVEMDAKAKDIAARDLILTDQLKDLTS